MARRTSRGVDALAVILVSLLVSASVGAIPYAHGRDHRAVRTVLASVSAPTRTALRRRLPHQPSKNPIALAIQIDHAQQIIDDASATPPKLESAGRFEQLAFRQLANRRAMRPKTLARLSPAARSAATASVLAADAIARIVPPERRFPDWRIIAPPSPNVLLTYFRAAAAKYGIPWNYLAAIEFVETRMGRIRGLSPAGAQGPMQFMAATWAEYGSGSIDSQPDAIMAAAHFLAANGGKDNIRGALFYYNPSRSYVIAVESYAGEMHRDKRAFLGYYYWRVLCRTVKGVFVLPVGYPRLRPERLPG